MGRGAGADVYNLLHDATMRGRDTALRGVASTQARGRRRRGGRMRDEAAAAPLAPGNTPATLPPYPVPIITRYYRTPF